MEFINNTVEELPTPNWMGSLSKKNGQIKETFTCKGCSIFCVSNIEQTGCINEEKRSEGNFFEVTKLFAFG